MSIETEFIQKMLTMTTITDVVDTRIKLVRFEQNIEIPALLLNFVSKVPIEHNGFASDSFIARVQIDCFENTYLKAVQLADIVRVALDNYTGMLDEIKVSLIRFISEIDDFEPEADNFRKIQEYEIVYNT